MGIIFNTVSICQFMVVGDEPAKDLYEWASDRLFQSSFNSIEDTTEEVSSGWVHLDDSNENSFASPRAFWRDLLSCFHLTTGPTPSASSSLNHYLKNQRASFGFPSGYGQGSQTEERN